MLTTCQSNVAYIRCRRSSKAMTYGWARYTSQFPTLIVTNVDTLNLFKSRILQSFQNFLIGAVVEDCGVLITTVFTRGQFWPSGIVVACVCVCVCVCVCLSVCLCVNHLLVRAITRDPFKLGSPNLDRRCKRPWLRSLLFLGAIDLDLQGQI